MRAASRLLANVKGATYLEAGTPTGLTGLLTHPSPRSTLVYLYSSTLDKLAKLPESSVYRQSTEALTKHRLAIIEAAKPKGWKEWQDRVRMQIDENPAAFEQLKTSDGVRVRLSTTKKEFNFRMKESEWDGEKGAAIPEGIRSMRDRARWAPHMAGGKKYDPNRDIKTVTLVPEPQLTAEQISEVESQIGAGLIEEVIQVAEGEHKLIDEMAEAKVWEELVEQAPEAQWTYFERPTGTKTY